MPEKAVKGWSQYVYTNKPKKNRIQGGGSKFEYHNAQQSTKARLKAEDFPQLNQQAFDHMSQTGNDTAIAFLQMMFPNLSLTTIIQAHKQCLGNISDAVEALLLSPDTKSSQNRGADPRRHQIGPNRRTGDKPKPNTANVPYLEARDGISDNSENQELEDLYKMLRRQSLVHLKKRNKFFLQAANAYDQEDHAKAQYLAAQGHEQNNLYFAEAQIAADNIFRAKNKSNPLTKIDLHGLHASEALERIEQRLTELKDLPHEDIFNQKLEIITGWGRGQTGHVILRPTVEDYLVQNHLPYKEPSPGKFLVSIK